MAIQSKRIQWIIFGAVVGGLFALWRWKVADAHLLNLVLGIGTGAFLASCLAERTPQERLRFIGLWLGVVACYSFFKWLLHQIWPMGVINYDSQTASEGATRLAAWGLTFAAIANLSILWLSITKRLSLREIFQGWAILWNYSASDKENNSLEMDK